MGGYGGVRAGAVQPQAPGQTAGVELQRHDHPAVVGQLVPPLGRDVDSADGDNDAVLRCPVRGAERAIAAADLDPVGVAGAGDRVHGAVTEILVVLDGHDPPVRADELTEQGDVEAGGGADLQDALTGLGRQLSSARLVTTCRGA